MHLKLCGRTIPLRVLLVTGPRILAVTKEPITVDNRFSLEAGVEIYLNLEDSDYANDRGRQSSKD